MSTYDSAPHKRGGTVRHSKQDALSASDFERLVGGAQQLDGDDRVEALAAVCLLGRGGLRRGELAHLQADWIDWRREMLRVPEHEPCHNGRGGQVCGACRQLAEQAVAHADGDADLAEHVAECWTPKTPAAARDIYLGWDARTMVALEDLLARHDGWPLSGQGVTRRVEWAAEAAAGIDADAVYPHALRATAATELAGRGLEAHGLLQYFGWAQLSTAQVYLSRSGANTARQLDSL